jgi:guanylate kinase
MLLVLSAPSGAGKSTLVKRLLAQRGDFRLSVSHTTRAPRPGEVDGVAYWFVADPTFDRLVAEGAFVEWAHVHGNRYGTSHAEIERLSADGGNVLFDVDVQGGANIRKAYPESVGVFVLPPSMAELERRLRGRGTEPDEVVRRRLANARGELREAEHYDYVIVNDDLDRATADLLAIIQAAPLATGRMAGLVQALIEETAG